MTHPTQRSKSPPHITPHPNRTSCLFRLRIGRVYFLVILQYVEHCFWLCCCPTLLGACLGHLYFASCQCRLQKEDFGRPCQESLPLIVGIHNAVIEGLAGSWGGGVGVMNIGHKWEFISQALNLSLILRGEQDIAKSYIFRQKKSMSNKTL